MMNRASRYATTISAIALGVALAGCTIGSQPRESIFGSKVDHKNIGIATRAQAALAANDLTTAVELAERAVENTPNDAGFRSLLGNCYFAAGRFASAEAAYRDSLSLIPTQPKIVLKLALVQIAQGKNSEAVAVLDFARSALDPADYGLAMALAGQADTAVSILNQAARSGAADGRVRQNLALAYGLSGDWAMARVVASQDVSPELVDTRIQQWMAMATKSRPSDQVAALTGVTPAADPGQPQRLALNSAPAAERQAVLDIPAIEPSQQVAQAQPQVPMQPPVALPEPMPEIDVAEAKPAEVPARAMQPVVDPAVVHAAQSLLQSAPPLDVQVAAVEQAEPEAVEDRSPEAPAVMAVARKRAPETGSNLPTRFAASARSAALESLGAKVRRSVASENASFSVVQLGAYSSPKSVSVAWDRLTDRFPALAKYTPMRARFDSSKGTVWRLSIKGFSTQQEALQRCETLRNRGGSCFVRRVAGDSPVQFASR